MERKIRVTDIGCELYKIRCFGSTFYIKSLAFKRKIVHNKTVIIPIF